MEVHHSVAGTRVSTWQAAKQDGFILVTVLLFLLLVGLIVLALLDSTHLALRMSQNYSLASQQFQAAEAGLKIAEERLASASIHDRLHGALNYAGYQVIYDIRRFSLAFCIDHHIAYYYHVTARANQPQGRAVVLQTTYAKKLNEKCQGKEKILVKEGRSSWRELNSIKN